jgi:hypothetical protein
MPKDRPIRSARSTLARRLVEVPMSVSIPPAIDAYDSGNSSFDGGMPIRSARSTVAGSMMATAAVLLITPDRGPVMPMVASSAPGPSPSLLCASHRVSRSNSPVRRTPSLRIISAAIVTVAGLAKPESPVAISTPVSGSAATSTTITPTAVAAIGTTCVTNSGMMRATSSKTKSIPLVGVIVRAVLMEWGHEGSHPGGLP